MKRPVALLPLLLLFLAACASAPGGGVTPTPGRGAVTIEIIPNPISARLISGTTYEFPFEAVIRETGGRAVDVKRVSADVFALGGLNVASETYDAAKIRALGFTTRIPANGEIRYRFAQRHEVPDRRFFSSVHADLSVDATDDGGVDTSATTRVTVVAR